MSDTRLLIVHSDPSASALMRSMLQSLGHQIEEASSDRSALRWLDRGTVDAILAGADPSDPDALELLSYCRRKHPQVPVILLFATAHPNRSREAMLRGAAAVLRFPMPATYLRATVTQVLGPAEDRPAVVAKAVSGNSERMPGASAATAVSGSGTTTGEGSAAHPARKAPGWDFVGEDPSLRQAIELAETIAPSRAPVLIAGERGTGKTLLARTLHYQSPRRNGPFLEVCCGRKEESLLGAELFGRRSGGRAEPAPDHPGKIALARGGTLFLDDVDALSPGLQAKLLRLLQDGVCEPLGTALAFPTDVRLVLGTCEDLDALVEQGQFRPDLFYRIGVVSLNLPPLRHRGADVVLLADHFRTRYARDLGKPDVVFSPEAIDVLSHHDWPGNVHELERAVERGVRRCRSLRIEQAHLSLAPSETPHASGPSLPPPPHVAAPGLRPLKEALEEPERQIILQTLAALNWNRQETARVLDINRTTLYKKMKKYGLLYDEPAPAWAN